MLPEGVRRPSIGHPRPVSRSSFWQRHERTDTQQLLNQQNIVPLRMPTALSNLATADILFSSQSFYLSIYFDGHPFLSLLAIYLSATIAHLSTYRDASNGTPAYSELVFTRDLAKELIGAVRINLVHQIDCPFTYAVLSHVFVCLGSTGAHSVWAI